LKMTKNELAKKVIDVLKDHGYPFGGYVRDTVAGENFSDLDIFLPKYKDGVLHHYSWMGAFEDAIAALRTAGLDTAYSYANQVLCYNPTTRLLIHKKDLTVRFDDAQIDVDLVVSNATSMVEDTPLPILDIDSNALYLDKNNRIKAIAGYDKDQVIANIKAKEFVINETSPMKGERIAKRIRKGHKPKVYYKEEDLTVGDRIEMEIIGRDHKLLKRTGTYLGRIGGESRVWLDRGHKIRSIETSNGYSSYLGEERIVAKIKEHTSPDIDYETNECWSLYPESYNTKVVAILPKTIEAQEKKSSKIQEQKPEEGVKTLGDCDDGDIVQTVDGGIRSERYTIVSRDHNIGYWSACTLVHGYKYGWMASRSDSSWTNIKIHNAIKEFGLLEDDPAYQYIANSIRVKVVGKVERKAPISISIPVGDLKVGDIFEYVSFDKKFVCQVLMLNSDNHWDGHALVKRTFLPPAPIPTKPSGWALSDESLGSAKGIEAAKSFGLDINTPQYQWMLPDTPVKLIGHEDPPSQEEIKLQPKPKLKSGDRVEAFKHSASETITGTLLIHPKTGEQAILLDKPDQTLAGWGSWHYRSSLTYGKPLVDEAERLGLLVNDDTTNLVIGFNHESLKPSTVPMKTLADAKVGDIVQIVHDRGYGGLGVVVDTNPGWEYPTYILVQKMNGTGWAGDDINIMTSKGAKSAEALGLSLDANTRYQYVSPTMPIQFIGVHTPPKQPETIQASQEVQQVEAQKEIPIQIISSLKQPETTSQEAQRIESQKDQLIEPASQQEEKPNDALATFLVASATILGGFLGTAMKANKENVRVAVSEESVEMSSESEQEAVL
jgi:hypothetical protein